VSELELEMNEFHANEEASDDEDDDDSVADPSDTRMVMFKQLREYRILNGDCKVPQRYAANPKLGIWVKDQKANYRKGKLTKDRIANLDGLGFVWGQKYPAPIAWEARFEELSKYKKAMKCDPPISESSPTPLAMWVSAQRKEFRRSKHGKDSLLTFEQI
ncbi:MAG: hypothetical protein SGILL_008732, partial [Bacillariaceae sp.]